MHDEPPRAGRCVRQGDGRSAWWMYQRAPRQKDPTDEFRTANANVSGELSDAECRIAKSEVGGWPEDRWDYAVTNALDKLEVPTRSCLARAACISCSMYVSVRQKSVTCERRG